MAKIIAGVGTSHTPAIGAAVDNGKAGEPYWAPLFKGYEPAKQWMAETKPDVVIMVYNDHVNAFEVPTCAIVCALGDGDASSPTRIVMGETGVPATLSVPHALASTT